MSLLDNEIFASENKQQIALRKFYGQTGRCCWFYGLWTPRRSEGLKHFASGSVCISSICVQLNPGQPVIPIIGPAAECSAAAARGEPRLQPKTKGRRLR